MKKNVIRRVLAVVAAFVMVFVSVKPANVYAAAGSYTNPTKGAVSKKGLQIYFGMLSDVEELGISEAFFNIPIESVLSNSETKYSYNYNGRVYYFNNIIEDYDTIVGKLTDMGINITIAFVNQYQTGYEYLLYPGVTRRDGTVYYGINTATSEGRSAVEAVCHYIAGRYNGTDKGKISNYVIGNEVNDNIAYNYVGEMEIQQYVSIYYQTFKTMYDALRAENASANVYIPLEPRWTTENTSKDYAGRDFLEIFDRFSKQDGNIYWNVAYHPYSFPSVNNNVLTDGAPSIDQNGKKTDGSEITYDQDTKLISMKNINVLTDYMQNSNMRNKDGNVRSIILSEQGYTSESPISGTDEKLQAASIAYAYYAAEMNPYIDAFILNGHIDAPLESGYFKFGLWNSVWSNEKNSYVPTTHKYAYNMYKYIDTARSLDVTNFALKTLGITSWNAVINHFDASKFSNMKSINNEMIYSVPTAGNATVAVVLSEGMASGFSDVDGDGNIEAVQPYWITGYNTHALSVFNYNKDEVAGTVQYFPNGTVVVDPNCLGYTYQEIYHEFDKAQDLTATPYLGFTIKFLPHYSSGDADSMVVRVRVYSGNDVYDANCQVSVNTDNNLYVDLSNWSGKSAVDKVAVWVKENTTSKSFDGVFTLYNFMKATGLNGATAQNRAVDDPVVNVHDSVFNPTMYGCDNYSDVYDVDFYYNNNPEVAASVGYNPVLLIEHFVTKGMEAGLQGSAEFNVWSYRNNYKDLADGFGDNLKLYYMHYIICGKAEGRTATGSDNSGGNQSGNNNGNNGGNNSGNQGGTTAENYVVDGVDYSAVFNADYYYNNNGDVAAALGKDTQTLLNHFVACGMNEGRQASEEFNVNVYKAKYTDLVNAFGADTRMYYLHYITCGKAEGRTATGSVNNGGNQGGNNGGSQSGTITGNYVVDGVDYSAVFNADYYYNNNGDVAAAFGKDTNALLNHFIACGMNEGRQASEEFNVNVYKTSYVDLVNAFGNDTKSYYLHYIRCGKAEGRTASGNGGNQGNITSEGYVCDGIDYSAVFDADYYYNHQPDIANALGRGKQALFNHFINYGMTEGRQASEEFNLDVYRAYNGDVVAAYGNDLKSYYIHYIKYGKAENRKSN